MAYVLALIAAITVAVLLWKAFGPEPGPASGRRPSPAPDDDPECLRRLGERKRRYRDGEDSAAS